MLISKWHKELIACGTVGGAYSITSKYTRYAKSLGPAVAACHVYTFKNKRIEAWIMHSMTGLFGFLTVEDAMIEADLKLTEMFAELEIECFMFPYDEDLDKTKNPVAPTE